MLFDTDDLIDALLILLGIVISTACASVPFIAGL